MKLDLAAYAKHSGQWADGKRPKTRGERQRERRGIVERKKEKKKKGQTANLRRTRQAVVRARVTASPMTSE